MFRRKYLTFKLKLAEREIFHLGLTPTPPRPSPLCGPGSDDNEGEESLGTVGTALMVEDVRQCAMSQVAVYQGARRSPRSRRRCST